MPFGTVINCLALYDNSADNPNNPDPKAAVTWGLQTFEEMMIGFLEIAPAAEGLVRHTPWWAPVFRRYSLGQLATIVLTAVNTALIISHIARFVRSRRQTALRLTNPPSAGAESR